jgi:RND family efflux transporter MFP subunit
VPVALETLQPSTVKDSSAFVGNLEAVQIVEIRPEIQGRIERILVSPGQEVGAGQSMMVLKPDQTVPQYEGAVAGVDVAFGNRDNALKALEVARAQRATAQSNLQLDTINVERAKMLVDAGALGQIRLDEALAKQEASKNSLTAAEQQVAGAQVVVQQAEAQVRQAQSQVQSASVSVGFKDVVSPIAGVVDNLPVKVGDYVSVGQLVTKVAQTDTLYLNIEVPPERASQLRTGLAVELLDPNSNQQLAVGNLTFVSPTVNTEAQSILTKAQFRNVDSKLRDGQFVQARIVWASQPGVLVPTGAISRVSGQDFVFLLDDQPNESGQEVVRLQPVKLGAIQGEKYQVLSGLKVGDRIAVSNILKLRDGAPIEPEAATPPQT